MAADSTSASHDLIKLNWQHLAGFSPEAIYHSEKTMCTLCFRIALK